MQRTVFFIAYTKKSTSSVRVVCKLHLRLLSSSLGNTVLLHIRYFSNTKHKSAKKKLDNVFQSNCSSRAELLTNLRKIEKWPKIRHKAVMHPALQLKS